jgi:hypothetical protein
MRIGVMGRPFGYESRPLEDTLKPTIDWYREMIDAGAFANYRSSDLSRVADSMRLASVWGC